MSFYTTEEQVYELFSRAGEIKKIIMGLDKNTKTPCGFCFVLWVSIALKTLVCTVNCSYSVLIDDFVWICVFFGRYYSREDTEDVCKYISGTILDDRPIRVDFDWGFQDGRQWGRGRSGGQVSISCTCDSYGCFCSWLIVNCFCGFVQVRDEYRTDYDPDILLIVECTFCL